MVFAMNWATVLLPQPAGPVMSQMWWWVVSGWLYLLVLPFVTDLPLVRGLLLVRVLPFVRFFPLERFETEGERGR